MIENWNIEKCLKIFKLPFMKLIYLAHTVHKQHFDPNKIQISTLLNIKSGNCGENCGYCSQSVHNKANVTNTPLITKEEVLNAAKLAKAAGSSRFCMGAAWRGPKLKDLEKVCEMVAEVKNLGLETCVTLGLLKDEQAKLLKQAGLDFYNHNIDTSEEYYDKVVTTRTFQDRLDTLQVARNAGIKLCCGGIMGMGESNEDRIKMLIVLANFNPQPESIPINKLIKVAGTPLCNQKEIDNFDFIRVIALARVMLPKSYIRISAGREQMSEEMQTLCFLAGGNSIFYGEKLLTTANSTPEKDNILFTKLGLEKLAEARDQI